MSYSVQGAMLGKARERAPNSGGGAHEGGGSGSGPWEAGLVPEGKIGNRG